MKNSILLLTLALGLLQASCNKKTYANNGEQIYKTGRNLQGEPLLDRSASRITIIHSCKGCHGSKGTRMGSVSIRFKDLVVANANRAPYNDSLFFRFLDEDLTSSGAKANIGVIWKMSDKDKRDLLQYLKTL
ncbi:MAG TPA: hypothetical protein VL307_06065 [Chitinophagaceae bacterium]|nr:hypothetical protein [Chitinophagaceae bacterium]